MTVEQSERDSIESWPVRLEQALADCELFDRVTVLRETDSTQDAAKRMNAGPGSVIVTGRQTAGRGRLGRAWIDEAGEGIAVTLVTDRGESERLALATSVGTARAAEAVLGSSVGIKWPNDITINGRKLAGILVEQIDQRAIIGVGMNVLQTSWPEELSSRAVSLRQLGCAHERMDLLAGLIRAIDRALADQFDVLWQEFSSRNALRSSAVRLQNDGRVFNGVIRQIDPNRGLHIECDDGAHWLPTSTTTVEGYYAEPTNSPSR